MRQITTDNIISSIFRIDYCKLTRDQYCSHVRWDWQHSGILSFIVNVMNLTSEKAYRLLLDLSLHRRSCYAIYPRPSSEWMDSLGFVNLISVLSRL